MVVRARVTWPRKPYSVHEGIAPSRRALASVATPLVVIWLLKRMSPCRLGIAPNCPALSSGTRT